MAMTLSMVAMMAPSAAPFFVAYGRHTRRPASVGVAILVFAGVWAAIGLAVDRLMSQVMMPPPSALLVAGAVVLAGLYSLSRWSRRAHAICRDMCSGAHGSGIGGALVDGLTYAGCCAACTAGLMVPLIVVGMSTPIVVAAGAAVMVAYKLTEWTAILRA